MRNRTSRIIINRRNKTIQFWKSWYPYLKEYPKTSRYQLKVEACIGATSWVVSHSTPDMVIYTRRNY